MRTVSSCSKKSANIFQISVMNSMIKSSPLFSNRLTLTQRIAVLIRSRSSFPIYAVIIKSKAISLGIVDVSWRQQRRVNAFFLLESCVQSVISSIRIGIHTKLSVMICCLTGLQRTHLSWIYRKQFNHC